MGNEEPVRLAAAFRDELMGKFPETSTWVTLGRQNPADLSHWWVIHHKA